jgi:ElaB/YqjD/DUF883 family membrane-anchored ribosome-binding protein
MNAPLATAVADYNVGRANLDFDTPFEELFDGVDDLIKRVADTENPEIRKIRAKVHASMMAAKSACDDRTHEVRRPSSPVDDASARAMEEEYPGDALGVALLVGLGLGVIMSIQP